MAKAAITCFTPGTPSARLSTIRLHTDSRSASLGDAIMPGIMAEAYSVRDSHWLRREHAANMVMTLLAPDAWLSQNIKKFTRYVSSWPD